MRNYLAACVAVVSSLALIQCAAAQPVYAGSGPYSIPNISITPAWSYANQVSPKIPINVIGEGNRHLQTFFIRNDPSGTFARAFRQNLDGWCKKNRMAVETVQQAADHFDIYVVPVSESSFAKAFPCIFDPSDNKAPTASRFSADPTAELAAVDKQIEATQIQLSTAPGDPALAAKIKSLEAKKKLIAYHQVKEKQKPATGTAAAIRTFTTGDGKHSLNARFVAKSEGGKSIYLEGKDGAVFEIQLEALSRGDQAWVISQS